MNILIINYGEPVYDSEIQKADIAIRVNILGEYQILKDRFGGTKLIQNN